MCRLRGDRDDERDRKNCQYTTNQIKSNEQSIFVFGRREDFVSSMQNVTMPTFRSEVSQNQVFAILTQWTNTVLQTSKRTLPLLRNTTPFPGTLWFPSSSATSKK